MTTPVLTLSRKPAGPSVRLSIPAPCIEQVHVALGRALSKLAQDRDFAIEAGQHGLLVAEAAGVRFEVEV